MDWINKNRLLVGSIFALAVYWGIGPFAPDPFLSALVSLFLLAIGMVSLIRFSPDVYRILIHKYRITPVDGRGYGAHITAYGFWLMAFGICYSGAYGQAWLLWGAPITWIGTVFSNFGRVCIASGFTMVWLSPDIKETGISIPPRNWYYLVAIGLLAIGVYLGMQIRAPGDPTLSDLPGCPFDRPIWGTRNHLYHTEESPYRDMIRHPVGCFRTEMEARDSGYVSATRR